MTDAIVEALRGMRPPFAMYEADLHAMIAARLTECGFAYRHEAPISRGCRIDFLVGDVGVEIKKGKPNPTQLRAQLLRYAQSDAVGAMLVVSERSVRLPAAIGGKTVATLVLSQLWGIGLP